MRIMCLNGWGGKLHESLIAYVSDASPDVLCLQEVVHTPSTTEAWLEYRDGDHVLPQRANFFRDVAKALPNHAATFCPAAQGVLWDGAEAVPSQWGLATFVRGSFPVIGQIQAFVHKDFSPDGYGDHPRSRNAHAVRIHDYEKGRTVAIVHTHGLRDVAAGKADTPARIEQARRLADIATRIAEDGDRLVVCGDLNVEPESETFRILGDIGLTDLVTTRGFAGTRTAQYPKPGRFADYMLVDQMAEPVSFEVVRNPVVSDHCPLLLEI
ncbi:endonuclease/exonuclease/phosphatase family protein [Aquibium oceanicum]|uniref:Metal-dependent hydrolase n=1 Tax=Aquibium oceanicum TaxID=1670800 RepID=A0A1L3SNT6_9HYPH|nr:endonuclease/exonuclease/phosphatase family protein [Aquibium oceanicum]APH71087.1 metal-dependent hydrolase [Aquibium oceanicum]